MTYLAKYINLQMTQKYSERLLMIHNVIIMLLLGSCFSRYMFRSGHTNTLLIDFISHKIHSTLSKKMYTFEPGVLCMQLIITSERFFVWQIQQ